MPTFSSAQVTDPFLSQNELLAPMLAHIAAQEKLGNLDINRRELALKENKFAQGLSLGDEFAKSITGDGTTGASIPGDSTPFERKMGFSEGGGTADKVNSEGYAGQYQFGAARLADLGLYTPAQGEDLKRNEWKGTFKIAPYGVANLQDFLKNPAAQHAAFVAHVADVDRVIDATPGADKFDRNGLRAVAHLGGNGGMQAFVASGGTLNRADSNGTSLKAYYQKFAEGGAPALQKAFGAAHGPGGPQSNLPTIQPGRLAGWVDPNAPLPVPPIPPAGGQPPAFNPNAGPRLAGASPAGAPGVEPAVAPGALPAAAAVGTDDPNAQVSYPPVVTGQADETVPVEPSRQAMRLGGTDVAGPPGVVTTPPDVQPNRMAYGTGLPGVTIGLPTNGLAPAPVTTAAAPPPVAQPPAPTPVQPPPAPSRVIQREPLIQSGMARGLTRDQALNAARLFKSGADPASVLQHIDQLRHQNDVIRQGDATQAAIDEKENYDRRQAATKAVEDKAHREETERIAKEQLRLQQEDAVLKARADKRAEDAAKQAGLPTGWRIGEDGKTAYHIAGLPSETKPLPETERKNLLDGGGKLDDVTTALTTFKPAFGGWGSTWAGDLANAMGQKAGDSPQADWWQGYQRYKLAVRQGISGQSLTASELGEFDKADINPGMAPSTIQTNLAHQKALIERIHGRRVKSLVADGYNEAAINAAGGERPASPASTTPTADPLSAARDAISKGAPRDAVIKRLRDNGIDPGGL